MIQSPESLADALVLVFTRGVSLAQWRELGLLEREWALYERIRPAYGRIVLVTHGGAEDVEIAGGLGGGVEVVCNERGVEPARYEGLVPGEIASRLAGADRVLVKTNQMQGGTLGLDIKDELRRRGIEAALIARGGYLWSRFEAAEHGACSAQALEAGEQERELCAGADLIVGTSLAMVGDLSWRHAIPRERIRLVPNYVVSDVPLAGLEGREPATILYAGQLVARKRVQLIVEAVAMLAEIGQRPARLSIIGDGSERAHLRDLARELGVDATFEARLPHRELLDRMARCTIYVQASALEGHPKTVLEAMATGAPVVVTDAPGLGGLVDHGITGLCFPADAGAIARGLVGLLDDPQWREAIGEAGAAAVRATYGLDRISRLELDGHREALRVASEASIAAPAPVRWSPALLSAGVEEMAGAWERSLGGFLRRLTPAQAAGFVARLRESLRRAQAQGGRDDSRAA